MKEEQEKGEKAHLRVAKLDPFHAQHAHAIRVDQAVQSKNLEHLRGRHQRAAAQPHNLTDALHRDHLMMEGKEMNE